MLGNETTEKMFSDKHLETKKDKLTCKICMKKYAVNDSLKVHMLTIHQKKMAFECTYDNCTKKYFNKFKLDCHFRTHTGERPFECSQCGKKFTTKGNLSTHSKLHGNSQKFTCPICNKEYTSKGNLINHINIVHLKQKKHKCKICKQSFGRASSLKTHSILHTGQKPFVCIINDCGKKYAEKGNLFIHQKHKHPDYFFDAKKRIIIQQEIRRKYDEILIENTLETGHDKNGEAVIDKSICLFENQCNISEDDPQEDILSKMSNAESDNMFAFYFHQQEEDNYTELGTCESTNKLLFPFEDNIN